MFEQSNDNVNLTENFKLSEFFPDGCVTSDPKVRRNILFVAVNLQIIRTKIDEPLLITSGFRTPAINQNVGGAKNSFHLTGKAVDIVCPELSPELLFEIFKRQMKLHHITSGGLGLYDSHLHYDIRGQYVEWRL